jgi:KaiC/GvpD/RAD55 family RecA-like ATPase
LSSGERVSIPLLAQLIPGGVKPGTIFTVEFDPDSQWLAISTTIAASSLKAEGHVSYASMTGPHEEVKESLVNLGVDIAAAIKERRLVIDDLYTATLTGGRVAEGGSKTNFYEGGFRAMSLKVADLSVDWLKDMKEGFKPEDVVETWPPGALGLADSFSDFMRFNEENPVLEFLITRNWTNNRRAGRISLVPFARGIHSEAFYKRLEGAGDGVIDVRMVERDGEARSLLRVRNLKRKPHDARWHEIEIKANGEAVLVI